MGANFFFPTAHAGGITKMAAGNNPSRYKILFCEEEFTMKELRKKHLIVIGISASLLICIPTYADLHSAAANESTAVTQNTGTAVRKGLTKQGKNYYYYSKVTGKKIKDKLVKIGKYKYGFDKKGRLVCGKTAKIAGFTYHFDKKGRALIRESKNYGTYYCVDTVTKKVIYARHTLKIVEKTKGGIIGKISGKTGELYMLGTSEKLTGKVFRSLQKGDKIRVWFDGMILETSPAQYEKVYKIEKQ